MKQLAAKPQATFLGALQNLGRGLYERTARFALYNGARSTATTRQGGRVGTNPNSTYASLQRVGMQFTAEMVAKNSAIGAAYLSQRQNYCSSMMIYCPSTGDTGLDKEIKQYLHGYDGSGGVCATMGVDCSMQDAFMRTADQELPVRGDAGMIWWEDASGDLRLIEFSADQIGEIYNFSTPRKCGLTKDANGNIVETAGQNDCIYFAGRYMRGADAVAYKIYERTNTFYANPVIYDAADVLFFKDPASFRGLRGVTIFANALEHMQKGEDMLQAALSAAQRQARTAGFVFNQNGQPDEGNYETANYADGTVKYFEREPGSPNIEYFYNGDSASFVSPDSPGPELIQGVGCSDERVAIALRVNYATLIACDRVGGAPSRLEVEKTDKEWQRIQTMIHKPKLRRIADVKLMEAVRKKIIVPPRGMTSDQFKQGRWMLPISASVDAFYDAEENVKMVRSGMEAPQDVIAETNRDWEDILNKQETWAVGVAKRVENANRRLVADGYKPVVTPADIAQVSDNPQQAANAESITQGKPASGEDTAKMAEWDESKHPRGQSENKGEFGPGGGGKSTSATIEKQKPKTSTPKCDDRCQKAKHSAVRVDAATQRKADEVEHSAAKSLGGISFKDSEPVDVVVGGKDNAIEHGIEFKHVSLGANDKLTMNTYAQIRKINWEKQNKATFHTLVYDDRNGEDKRVIYYRRGVAGSARLGTMYKCKDINEAKRLMAMNERQLPEGAQRTDGKLRVGRWKDFQDKDGKGFRNIKTGEVFRAKK